MEFEIGDIVEAFGLRGTVVRMYTSEENPNSANPSLVVEWDENVDSVTHHEDFMSDGKKEYWHTETTLRLIERPEKPLVKRKVTGWLMKVDFEDPMQVWYRVFKECPVKYGIPTQPIEFEIEEKE